jgi:hypothetical protein
MVKNVKYLNDPDMTSSVFGGKLEELELLVV